MNRVDFNSLVSSCWSTKPSIWASQHTKCGKREGIRYETLFRGETVGALDAVNGKEYVGMLRRAMDLGGFHQVIFICHTPLVGELADRVVEIRDGRAALKSGLEELPWPTSAYLSCGGQVTRSGNKKGCLSPGS